MSPAVGGAVGDLPSPSSSSSSEELAAPAAAAAAAGDGSAHLWLRVVKLAPSRRRLLLSGDRLDTRLPGGRSEQVCVWGGRGWGWWWWWGDQRMFLKWGRQMGDQQAHT